MAACGGSDDGASGRPEHIEGSLQQANCEDWNRASEPQRRGTIDELENLNGGEVAGASGSIGHGSVLTERQAYALFERSCAADFARNFNLYKMYGRAAGFSAALGGEGGQRGTQEAP